MYFTILKTRGFFYVGNYYSRYNNTCNIENNIWNNKGCSKNFTIYYYSRNYSIYDQFLFSINVFILNVFFNKEYIAYSCGIILLSINNQ